MPRIGTSLLLRALRQPCLREGAAFLRGDVPDLGTGGAQFRSHTLMTSRVARDPIVMGIFEPLLLSRHRSDAAQAACLRDAAVTVSLLGSWHAVRPRYTDSSSDSMSRCTGAECPWVRIDSRRRAGSVHQPAGSSITARTELCGERRGSSPRLPESERHPQRVR